VLVVGPRGPTFVEPYRVVQQPLRRLRPVAPPAGGYVLVFPMLRGCRPGPAAGPAGRRPLQRLARPTTAFPPRLTYDAVSVAGASSSAGARVNGSATAAPTR
jgi:hypothetical protein